MITIIDETFSPTEWNNYATNPMQSWEWGEVRKKEGKKIVRFVEYGKKGETTTVYLMTIHPVPLTSYSVGYIPKSSPPSKEFITYLKSYAQMHKFIFIKLEPNLLHKLDFGFSPIISGQQDFPPKAGQPLAEVLVESQHPLFTQWNQVLDISLSEEDMLKNMHPKTRYNIRLAEKKGVQVHEMTSDNGYQIFEKLYFETCARQKYRGHTRAYHQNIWDTLLSVRSQQSSDNPPSTNSLQSRILVAFYKDVPLAAYQVWHFKDTLFYVYGGSSEEYKNVMAANLLMWETIRLAKQLGCKTLDMWGSLPPTYDKKDPWAGFTKFKQGYGTKFIQYAGSYDLVVNPLVYKLYSIAQTLRQKLIL